MNERPIPKDFTASEQHLVLEEEKISRVRDSISAAHDPLPYFLQMKKRLETDAEISPSQVFGEVLSEIEKVNAANLKYKVGNTQEPFFTLSNTELTKNHPITNFEMVHPEKRRTLIKFFKTLGFDKETVSSNYLRVFVLAESNYSTSNNEKLILRTYITEILDIIDEVYGTE